MAVRLLAFLSGFSLLAAAAVLVLNAGRYPHPGHQLYSAAPTALAGALLIFMGVRAFTMSTRTLWQMTLGMLGAVIVLALVRYISPLYFFAYRRDIESLFPSVWVFGAALPLLILLLLEFGLPNRYKGSPSALGVILAYAAVVAFFYFGATFVAMVGQDPGYFMLPTRLLSLYVACIGATLVLGVVATVARKGRPWEGILVAGLAGLGLQLGALAFWGDVPGIIDPTERVDDLTWQAGVLTMSFTGSLFILSAVALWRTEFLRPSPARVEASETPVVVAHADAVTTA